MQIHFSRLVPLLLSPSSLPQSSRLALNWSEAKETIRAVITTTGNNKKLMIFAEFTANRLVIWPLFSAFSLV